MLIRHTLLYLPAQLLPALAQFVSLIIWSHFTTPEVIGIVTLLVSIQEFLVLGFMGFWTNYTVRYASKADMGAAEALTLARTSTIVVFGSSIGQAIVATILYLALIDSHPSALLLGTAGVMVAGRAFNSFQAERGRGRGDILLYSVGVMAGPVVGMLVGVGLILLMGSGALPIFLGFAAAQLVAVGFGLMRDRSWIAIGPASSSILKHALIYGLPLILSAVCIWLTQNVARLLVNHYSGLAAAGIYALGFGLGFRVAVVAAMSVTAAAFPIAVRYANAGEHDKAMAQLSKNVILLMLVLMPSMVGLAMVARDLLNLTIAEPLRAPAYPIMLWAILAGTLICFRQHFLHQVFLLKGNTHVIGKVSLAETLVAIVTTFFLVKSDGAIGGIRSLAFTSMLSTAVMMVLALRAGLRPPWLDLGKIGLATLAMATAVYFIPAGADVLHLALRIAAGGGVFVVIAGLLYGREAAMMLRNRKSATNGI